MKVSDAEKKICPFMSNMQTLQNASNGHTTDSHEVSNNVLCKTSSCMAWKMTKSHYETSDLTEEENSQITPPDRYFNMPKEDYEGYCIRLGKGY